MRRAARSALISIAVNIPTLIALAQTFTWDLFVKAVVYQMGQKALLDSGPCRTGLIATALVSLLLSKDHK